MPQLRFEEFATEKEEQKVSNYNVDLILSAEGLATFIADLAEMKDVQVYKRDSDGHKIVGEDGNYVKVDVPVTERWVSPGEFKWTGEKFVVRTNIDVLTNMEALNARRTRIASYQGK